MNEGDSEKGDPGEDQEVPDIVEEMKGAQSESLGREAKGDKLDGVVDAERGKSQ